MGHAERIIAEIPTLDEREQAGLLEYVDKSKAGRASTQAAALTDAQACEREPLAVELAPFRVSFAGHKFDRDEANAR